MSKEEVEKVLEEIKSGDSFANIARRHNVTYSAVSKIAYRRGIRRKEIIEKVGSRPKRAQNKKCGLSQPKETVYHDDGKHDCEPILCTNSTMKKCYYSKNFDGVNKMCDYMCMENKRRPCKGYECTKFRTKAQAMKWAKEGKNVDKS